MRLLSFRGVATAAVLACALTALPAPAAPAAPRPRQELSLAELRARLDAATARAETAADAVVTAALRSESLRVAMDELAEERERALEALRDRVRGVYMRGRTHPLVQALSGASLHQIALAGHGYQAGVRSDQELVAAVTRESAYVRDLRRRSEALRDALLKQAEPVFRAQDEARALLAEAELRFAADQAALAALRERKARLDAVSSRVAYAVAPAVTARGRKARAVEEPVIRLLESSGPGIPPGYRRTGVVVQGIASWYGPGFVGNPTASGSPYDPERLTAAMLPPVKLGTVVHVTTTDGLSINVLVNDRGPYGKGRVIDLSRAGSRLLGFDGLKKVSVELLEPE